ncbi:hypothetical protein [Deinococcus cellulosilyticus]|uniref:Uncharacterized protein n=1 Tax=Deinococcus cellulosilyticus (strain DSM 18568 / NBRC 106333 / KACC 11606 / 5516J-15) TaxID=1223518 RepID=A0A511N9N1_DEIC1|nr:hypothetical protein [Deinococcus cellulosilyticus]GEM49226.1 hypothetical protein DC3_48610 [Deinococcus cellulosilyticus NBRC 106333 = KACC 11606]
MARKNTPEVKKPEAVLKVIQQLREQASTPEVRARAISMYGEDDPEVHLKLSKRSS